MSVPPQSSKQETDVREMVRYAIMAPSSHNTQCWNFRYDSVTSTITVRADFARACRIVDPDNHHLYVSLGCAVENLVLAAHSLGYTATVDSTAPDKNGIQIQLSPSVVTAVMKEKAKTKDQLLYEAIPQRQVTRSEYDGKPLSQAELDQLQEAASSTVKGVRIILLTDRDQMDQVLQFVLPANTLQMDHSSFMDELRSWIRFNNNEAVTTRDGLYGKCFGNPSAPRFIGNLFFKIMARPGPENQKISRQVKSSAGIAVFVSEQDDPEHWVEAGRSYERFALQATALGVRNAMLNQPVEEAAWRPRFSLMLGLKESERADLVVRFGKGPEMPRSLRRPIEDVLVCE